MESSSEAPPVPAGDLLAGKVAWITGASRGIGAAIALLFSRHGAQLALAATAESKLADTADKIKSAGGEEPLLLAYDVADSNAVKTACLAVRERFGTVDAMVNNAGILEDALLGMVRPPELERTFAVNTFALAYHMQYASRLMARKRNGSIINVSSIIGRVGNAGQVVYGGSKAAAIGMTLSAAKELAPGGIRVNAIAPGYVDTDMIRSIPEEKHAERIASIAMKRIGTGDDVAGVALFLASDLSRYVTGQVIGVDGGMLI